MTIYFARHGETDWNVKKKIQGTTDIPLNENGILQARHLAETLQEQHLPIRSVYTSPQKRARETARIAADAIGAECIIMEELREMDLGQWEGSNWDIIEAENSETYRAWIKNKRYVHTPGGENYNELLRRTLEAAEYILAQETGDVLVVSHSAVIMVLRCYIVGMAFEKMPGGMKLRNAQLAGIPVEELREAIARFHREEADGRKMDRQD